MSRYMNLTVVEVRGPDEILARETPGPTASAETVEYASFFKEMNNYFNNNALTFESHSPKPNEICAVLNSRNNRWHRVRVREVMTTLSGAKANCFFLDTGENQMVQIVKMKKVHERFLTVPFQVKVFALYGLQPLSLVIDPTMTASKKPCKKWDKSAAIHIKKLINSASAIQAVIKSKGEENVLLAVIYLRFSGNNEILSLNDEMVNKGYAIKDPQINKSFAEETNNFLQDVFQTKHINERPSQKPEQLEYNSSDTSSVSLNGFHRKLRVNDCPVRVGRTRVSDIPRLNSSDDSDSLSSSPSSSPRNNFAPKECRKIPSSSDIPFKASANRQTSSNFSALNQLLSYHKRLQQNNKMERKSDSSLSVQPSYNVTYSSRSLRHPVESKVSPLKSHDDYISPSKSVYQNSSSQKFRQKLKSDSVSYQQPNIDKNTWQAASKSRYLDVPKLESDSSYMTEDSEMFYDSEETREKNSISAVISTNPIKRVISKHPLVKNPQTSPDRFSKLKTESALSNLIAYHKKLVSSNQDSEPDFVALKANNCFSNMSAKMDADDKNNQSENSFSVSHCKTTRETEEHHQKKSVHNDKCDSKMRLSSCGHPQPVVNQSTFAQEPLKINTHCYQSESDLPFRRIQPEDDGRPSSAMDFHCDSVKKTQKIKVPPSNSAFAKSEDRERKPSSSSSEDFHSTSNCNDSSNEYFFTTNKTPNRKDEETVDCNIVTNEQNDNTGNPSRNCCISKKNVSSEAENSEICQSDASSKETVLASSGLSSSAVNILNHSVSSKLLSSSPSNTIRMLQGLNIMPKLNICENSNSSESGFSKKWEPFASIDDSDSSETVDEKPYLGAATFSHPGRNSSKDFKNQEREVATSDNSEELRLIQLREFSDFECLAGVCATSPVPLLNPEETLGSGFKSQVRSLQPYAASSKQNFVFEDKREKPIIASKQEDLNLPKIENLPEITAAIPDLEQDHSAIDDMKINEEDIVAFIHESKNGEKDDPSFELLPADENHDATLQSISTNADLTYKDCVAASDSDDYHNHASDTEISQENKSQDILPPTASENQEKNPSVEITAGNGKSPIHSRKSSSSDKKVVGVLSSDEYDKHKLESLKYVEPAEGNENFSSSVDTAKESDPETISVVDSKEVASSAPVDIKTVPITCKDNTESTFILDSALSNVDIESPSTVVAAKKFPRLEADLEFKSLSTLPGDTLPMPDLIDLSTDFDSELISPAKDPKTDLCPNINEDVMSATRSSIECPDVVTTESEASSAKVISDISELISPAEDPKIDLSPNMNEDLMSASQTSIEGPDIFELISPAISDPKIDSTSISVSDPTVETKFRSQSPNMNANVRSSSQSSIEGSDDIAESEASTVKTISDISELISPAKDPQKNSTSTSMPDLTDVKAISDISLDVSTDSDSELISPAEDPKDDSASISMPDLTVATVETKFTSLFVNTNEDVLSASQSSITGPDDITESEASSVKVNSDMKIQLVSSSPQSITDDDCNISSLLTIDNEKEEFESMTSSDNVEVDITPENNPDSILPPTPSVPDTYNGPQLLLPSVTDINDVVLPELVNSMLPSETVDDKLDDTMSAEECSSDQYESDDLCFDTTHTISNANAQTMSNSHDNTKTTSAGCVQPISSPGNTNSNTTSVSLSSWVSPDQAKKDPTSSEGKSLNARDRAMDCIRGRSILEKLGVTKKAKEMEDNHTSLSTESILLNDSILFVAEKIPNPIYNIQDFNVPEVLSQLIENLNIQPKPIQAYSWGPVIRGKNVIGISPPGSGKTWAYIVPILASLCQYNIYSDIKFSNGPFVLILVPSWKKAISVYEQCKRISQINREIIVEVVYGGGEESKKSVHLLNGCHILVATLPCFQRMLQSKFTNLDRLCHLVIDDADILLQDFYKEIVNLMCKYKSVVESRDKSYERHQVMAYSSKWTSYIKGFVKNAIHDPVIAITDMMEAAVYGRVKQIPIMCEESDRKDQLVKLVPQIIKKGEKIIIFAPDNECFELQILLNHLLQKTVAVACDTLYKSEQEIIATEWKLPLSEKESYRVLVCSDVALCDLYINDATCVVHYQMPKRKIHIGLRIQAMSNYYQHYNNDKPPVKIVESYILITPQDKKQVKSLKSFLMRSTDVTDKKTWDFLSNIRQVEDLDPEKELCMNIKAFGRCRNKHQCNDRHSVVPSVDLNGACSQHICLPHQGDVRVKILHVKTANNFYVRILEHQIGTQKSIQVHSDLASLIMGMALYYSSPSNRQVLDELTSGMLCVVNTSEQFSRVKVLQPYDNASKNTAKLIFVDIGKVESHPICNLYQLAEEFKAVPFQAVEVFLCRLYPVDSDTEWTPAANSFAESWLESKMLYGKIRFVMDNTLWLDPLLERTFMKAIKTVTNSPSLRRELISNNLAIDNPQHLMLLHTQFEGYVPKLIPSTTLNSSCTTWEFELESETLQAGDDYENVTISYIFTPEHFYVQRLDMKICLNDLMMKIQEKMSLETEPQQKREWLTGVHCLSKSSLDSRWYRVIILTLLDSKAVVHFIDYGNIEEVCIDELQTMPRELMYLPSQAIECKLAHIKPSEKQWSEKCNDIMYYISMTADNIHKTLAVNVVYEMSTEGKLPQYYVNLLDTSYERVINIAQELVWWKMASATDDHFQPLFPAPTTPKMVYPSASKIADMCAVLYYEKSSSQEYTQLIMSYLKACLKHPEKLIEENVPGCFLKLLSYSHDPDLFSSIVDYVKLLMSTPSLFDNLLSCGILQSLGQVLKMHDDVSILYKTFQLILFMTETNTSLIQTIASLKSGLFSIMCEMVNSIYPNEIKISVCQLLESLCLADQKCTENLIQLQVCPLLLPDVLEIQDHDLTEAYLSLLVSVSLLDSGLIAIKREKPIEEIMKIVEEATCEKCVCKCLVVLKRLADKSRKNKTQLLELNAVAIFSSCQNLVTGTEAAALCQELLDGLLVKVNYNQNFSLCTQLQQTNERNFRVLWCQNKFRLLITLKIKNSEWSGCEFQKTSVHFSFVLSDGVNQTVNYELFDEVVVEKCAVCMQNNEVILSLSKAEVKYWPRLLQDKYNKPPNLYLDFEKIEDSDDSGSEEFEADEENLFTLQVVVKKPLIPMVKMKSSNDEEEEKKVALPVDTTKSDEDSLENSDFEDFDRFNIFSTKYK